MPISLPLPAAASLDTTQIGWTDPESSRSLLEAMTLHADDPDFLALDTDRTPYSLASPEAIAQRDRERIANGMLRTPEERMTAIRRIVEEVARLPVFDDRSPDEILGYDESGLPT